MSARIGNTVYAIANQKGGCGKTKERLDAGEIPLRAAVTLSYLTEAEQRIK